MQTQSESIAAAHVHTGTPVVIEMRVVPVAGLQASTPVATAPAAPVAVPAPKPKAKPVRSHKVGKGETLGRIADKFDCDVRELAKANGLKAPAYALRQGQSIKLQGCGK